MSREHDPGCVLDPVHWLRHAIEATNMRISGDEEEQATADKLSSASLLNALEHLAEQEDWRTVTLLGLTQFVSLMGEKFPGMCTCGRDDPPGHSRDW